MQQLAPKALPKLNELILAIKDFSHSCEAASADLKNNDISSSIRNNEEVELLPTLTLLLEELAQDNPPEGADENLFPAVAAALDVACSATVPPSVDPRDATPSPEEQLKTLTLTSLHKKAVHTSLCLVDFALEAGDFKTAREAAERACYHSNTRRTDYNRAAVRSLLKVAFASQRAGDFENASYAINDARGSTEQGTQRADWIAKSALIIARRALKKRLFDVAANCASDARMLSQNETPLQEASLKVMVSIVKATHGAARFAHTRDFLGCAFNRLLSSGLFPPVAPPHKSARELGKSHSAKGNVVRFKDTAPHKKNRSHPQEHSSAVEVS